MKSSSAPKDKNKEVYPLENWKLSNLIDVACDLKFLGEDTQKVGHVLREYRNYIHPHKQIELQFTPDMDTARTCVHVLSAVIRDLNKEEFTNEQEA